MYHCHALTSSNLWLGYMPSVLVFKLSVGVWGTCTLCSGVSDKDIVVRGIRHVWVNVVMNF